MGMSIQNRSVLYKTPEPVLVPEGAYEAELVEVKREAKVVAEILKQRNAGASLADIAESLHAQGIEGTRGGRWYGSTVRYRIQRQTA